MEIRQLSIRKFHVMHDITIVANNKIIETMNIRIRYKLSSDHENRLNILQFDKLIKKISMKYGIKIKLMHLIYQNINTPCLIDKYILSRKLVRIEFDKEWYIKYNRNQIFKSLLIK